MPTELFLAQRNEVIRTLEPKVRIHLLPGLKSPKPWTAPDVLPDTDPDSIKEFRRSELQVSDALLTCFIAHTATEENLPHYLARLNMFEAMRDETGIDEHGWAKGGREWTSQEYVHGLTMMQYLDRLGRGRVNMREIVRTNQYMIRAGFNMEVEDPYEFFIFTTVQEDLTKVAHGRTAALAKKEGGEVMAKVCSTIVGDEARHYRYYRGIGFEIILIDAPGFVVALANKLEKYIYMPTRTIDDGRGSTYARPRLFVRLGQIEEALGIFTAKDYSGAIGNAIKFWRIEELSLSGEAARAQDKVMQLKKKAEAVAEQRENSPKADPNPLLLLKPRIKWLIPKAA